ncbi:MAG: hypothetical protein RMZ69_28460 [Nostoc sp. ChiQUE01a]|nr:hypothetical protein [Nostoc sp. ChiQUE01a]
MAKQGVLLPEAGRLARAELGVKSKSYQERQRAEGRRQKGFIPSLIA